MNYTFMPSLKHRTLVKITAALWNRSDIRGLVAGCLTRCRRLCHSLCDPFIIHAEKWQELEDKVIGMVPKLPLAVSLKKEVLDLAQRMGLQVKKWKKYNSSCNIDFDIDISAELCWTPQGTVDRKKTAEVLVKDERIDITVRYRLACYYCLEDAVKELWNSMGERKKKDIYDEEKKNSVKNTLTVWWTCYLTDSSKCYDLIKERARREVSPYQFLFEHSAENANKAATEYFLQKLTPREREECLVQCAIELALEHWKSLVFGYYDTERGYSAEMLCFLLSQMDVEQQVKLLKVHHYEVLLCLLDWPWQSFFMETANRVWDNLSDDKFELLLEHMVSRVKDGCKKCNYQKLFSEFWQQSPNTPKKFVAGELTRRKLLPDLFEIEDKENIRLIFKNITLEEREEIFLPEKGWRIFEKLISDNKWDLLKFYLQECLCILSEDMRIDTEKDLWYIISKKSEESPGSEKNFQRKKVFQYLVELRRDYQKRRRVE